MRRAPLRTRPARLALLVGFGLLAASAARADDALQALPEIHSGALRVYLVRHGQALSNLDPAPDLPPEQLDHLTELGKRQAGAVGRALAGRGVTAVLTSPASRARETAESVALELGLPPPAVEARLSPMAVGNAPDGRALAFKERVPLWQSGRDPTPPGGESMAAVGDRVHALVRALARSRRGASLVLVAHSEVLGSYLGRLRGTPPAERFPAGIANGSITVVDVMATGAETILLSNHVPQAP